MKRLLHYIELGWQTLSLVLLTSAFIPLWLNIAVQDTHLQNSIIRMTWLVSYITIPLIGLHWKELLIVISKDWRLWPFLLWSLLSLLWSQNPFLTLQKFYLLLFATLYGLLLAFRYPFRVTLRLIGSALAIVIASSALSIMIGAEWAVMTDPHAGSWRGVMPYKNILGSIAAISCIVFVFIAQYEAQRSHVIWWILAVSSLMLMIGSRSATAFITFVCTAIAWLVMKGLAHFSRDDRFRAVALSCCFVIPAGILGIIYWPKIAVWLGRESTLTGRAPLWQALLTIGQMQPLLGYGYGTFWSSIGGMKTIDVILLQLRFPWASHAHNGYLEVWLELGVIGFILILFPVLLLMFRSGEMIFSQKRSFEKSDFIFAFLTFFLVNNLTESLVAKADLFQAFFWVVFSWLYFSVYLQDISNMKSEAKHFS